MRRRGGDAPPASSTIPFVQAGSHWPPLRLTWPSYAVEAVFFDMQQYPIRRKNRLSGAIYSENGAYFITICTKDKACLFWAAGATMRRPPECLTPAGMIASDRIRRIDDVYPGIVHVDNAVVMPNHVHLLLSLHGTDSGGRRIAAPTIMSVVNQYKGAVSKAIGFSCWQKSFHDHIVRSEADYQRIWEYIDANPGKWEEDRYYVGIDS